MSSESLESLTAAVYAGKLEAVKESINPFNRNYSPPWSKGYHLLCYAIANKHREIAIQLLQIGCKVNSNDIPRKDNSDTPLHSAIENFDTELVKWLLARNANINVKNKDGLSCLDLAASKKFSNIFEILSNQEKYINSIHLNKKIFHQHYLPIHYAVEAANEEKIKFLIENDYCVDSRDLYGKTPLHIAAEAGYLAIVEYLLNHEACIDSICSTKFNRRYTPLHFAASEGNTEMANLLLGKGAEVDGKTLQVTPLYIAVQKGDEKMVKLLVENGANVNARDKNGKTILYLAYEEENSSIIDIIKKCHPEDLRKNCTRRGSTGLHTAAKNWNLKIAASLIADGADVNAKDDNERTPISYAIDSMNPNVGELSIIQLLLRNGARIKDCPDFLHTAVRKASKQLLDIYFQQDTTEIDIDSLDRLGRTALHIASKHRNCQLLRRFIQIGANINHRDVIGKTALHFACENFLAVMSGPVGILLNNGADILARDENGKTALHFACEKSDPEVVDTLVRHGADIEATEKNGKTALHYACRNGNSEYADILLKSGADIHARDSTGKTSLHFASEHKDPTVIEILLKYGADINSRDRNGGTALHRAAENCRDKAVKILLDNGADINSRDERGITALHRIRDYPHYYLNSSTRSTAKIFKNHILKMTIANIYVSEHNFKLNFDKGKAIDYKIEIYQMKRERIGNDYNITYYDVLTKGINKVAMYARNQIVLEAFQSGCYKIWFPLYSNMLENNFKRGKNRQLLLDRSVKSLNSLFEYELPDLFVLDMFAYLDNADLKNLISASAEEIL